MEMEGEMLHSNHLRIVIDIGTRIIGGEGTEHQSSVDLLRRIMCLQSCKDSCCRKFSHVKGSDIS